MADEPSQGEILASFGGDLDMYTAYHCGQIDESGNPTGIDEHYEAEAENAGQEAVGAEDLSYDVGGEDGVYDDSYEGAYDAVDDYYDGGEE